MTTGDAVFAELAARSVAKVAAGENPPPLFVSLPEALTSNMIPLSRDAQAGTPISGAESSAMGLAFRRRYLMIML